MKFKVLTPCHIYISLHKSPTFANFKMASREAIFKMASREACMFSWCAGLNVDPHHFQVSLYSPSLLGTLLALTDKICIWRHCEVFSQHNRIPQFPSLNWPNLNSFCHYYIWVSALSSIWTSSRLSTAQLLFESYISPAYDNCMADSVTLNSDFSQMPHWQYAGITDSLYYMQILPPVFSLPSIIKPPFPSIATPSLLRYSFPRILQATMDKSLRVFWFWLPSLPA